MAVSSCISVGSVEAALLDGGHNSIKPFEHVVRSTAARTNSTLGRSSNECLRTCFEPGRGRLEQKVGFSDLGCCFEAGARLKWRCVSFAPSISL